MTETPTAPSSFASPFGEYPPASEHYDEVSAAPGVPRPHWQKFVDSFNGMGREELAVRSENARRIIRDQGVTYNIYGDPLGVDRPWELDLVPLLIPPEEWRQIEAGLIQRTKLFNLILADLYGQQRLLRDGILPPALVFANPAFLRACHGVPVPHDMYLHLHAVDLARSPNGQWWALADRTQAPSGAGYALGNRLVLSRVLPDEFQDCNVQRLAPFFSASRDALRNSARTNRDNPNIVLLTPGPHNETYFEHAFLARYLGFTLVEGGDLTVRDGRVFLKTLEGLRQVDVILRRVDDTFCDPLELRGDSFLGIPGLVEAVRMGNVTVANALGSGLIESPGFLAFLPALCRHLLGEKLKLPSVATWWCGQGTEQTYVNDHLEKIVVKSALSPASRQKFFGATMDGKERIDLLKEIQARPHEFIGQEQVALSRAPVWSGQQLEPRPIVLRAYVTAGTDSYVVMPGGLTRVSPTEGDPIVSMQSGGGSKDTWILSDGPVSNMTLLSPSGIPTYAQRLSSDLPSRVADNLFWLGRYTERLEDRLRLLRCIIARLDGESTAESALELAAMAEMLVAMNLLPKSFLGRFAPKDLEHHILLMIYNQQKPGNVRELLNRIRQITTTVRDRLSVDTWRILNELQSDSRSRPGRIPLANSLTLLNRLIVDLAAFSGMEMENMTRGHGWRFLDFGRRLERSTNLTALLRAAIATVGPKEAALEPVLEIADSVMTYRRRYFSRAQLPAVMDLLITERENPRGLAFQLRALSALSTDLPQEEQASNNASRQKISRLAQRLAQTDSTALCENDQPESIEVLETWLDTMSDSLNELSDDLTHHYFSHTVAQVSQPT